MESLNLAKSVRSLPKRCMLSLQRKAMRMRNDYFEVRGSNGEDTVEVRTCGWGGFEFHLESDGTMSCVSVDRAAAKAIAERILQEIAIMDAAEASA